MSHSGTLRCVKVHTSSGLTGITRRSPIGPPATSSAGRPHPRPRTLNQLTHQGVAVPSQASDGSQLERIDPTLDQHRVTHVRPYDLADHELGGAEVDDAM